MPEMKMIDVWCVYTGGDDHRRGSITPSFSTERMATTYAKGRGWYGGDASVEKRQAIVYDTCSDFKKSHPVTVYLIDKVGEIDLDGKKAEYIAGVRKRAKAKLTEEELEALKSDDEEDD